MRPKGRPAVLAMCISLLACSPGASESPSASAVPSLAPPSAASPSEGASGSVGRDQIVKVGDRQATVYAPPGSGTAPAPLIVLLHGYSSSAPEHRAYFRFDRVASERGVVLAYPEGTRDRDGNRFWNATNACCNFHGSDVDDVAYLVDLVGEIGKAIPIDPKRVYLVGHSNGGFMSYRMVCEQAATFAAIVSLAGATFDDDADCAPSGPVAVLQIHGTADDTILLEGGTLDIGGSAQPRTYPGAKATAMAWAVYDRCATAFETLPQSLDIDSGIGGPNGPTETKLEVAEGCPPGGHVELWTIPGGSHVPDLSTSFPTDVIDFLLAHPKP